MLNSECNNLKAKILIVDHKEYNSLLIREILKTEGYSNITEADSGDKALGLLAEDDYNLVLLDSAIPDISSIDICQQIKSKDVSTAVIIQTANDNENLRRDAFESGANDFISKPIEKTELVTRVRLHLEQQSLYSKVLENHTRMLQELEDAQKMLLMMLPSDEVINDASSNLGIDVASHYEPSSELGGDFYDVAILDENRMAFYIWDFAGHGVGAAINTFRLHSLIKDNLGKDVQPAKFMNSINKQLHKIIPIGQFATVFFGIFDAKQRKIDYSFASCPQPILLNCKDKVFEVIETRSFPLGIQDSIDYEQGQVDMNEWDTIILYSDALTETPNQQGEFLTQEDIANIAFSCPTTNGGLPSPHDIKVAIMNKFSREYSDALSDDLTLNIINFNAK